MRKPIRKFTVGKLEASQQATIADAEARLKKYVSGMTDKEVKDTVRYLAESVWQEWGHVEKEFLTDRVDEIIHQRTGKKTLRQVNLEQDALD